MAEQWLAYGGYLAWLLAGFGDFLCHRRTNLTHTSGVAESSTHLLQLAIVGVSITVAMGFEMGPAIALFLCAAVVAHSVIGYRDTRIAFGSGRVILPIEQHLHSVLDMAPIVGLAWFVAATWPAALGGGWQPALRNPSLPVGYWLAVFVPAGVLCVGPALAEFVSASQARRDTRPIGQTPRRRGPIRL